MDYYSKSARSIGQEIANTITLNALTRSNMFKNSATKMTRLMSLMDQEDEASIPSLDLGALALLTPIASMPLTDEDRHNIAFRLSSFALPR